MWRVKLGAPRGTATRWAGLVTLLLVLSVVSCDGQGSNEPSSLSSVVKAENAEVGKTLEGQGWVVTLADPPEKRKEVGEPDVHYEEWEEYGFPSVATTEDLWLILSTEVTNDTGEMALLPQRLLKVRDAQGREYELAGKMVHWPLIWVDARWMKEESYFFADVFDNGVTLEGPLIYEVPEDATGLTLVMEGTEETIDLGF